MYYLFTIPKRSCEEKLFCVHNNYYVFDIEDAQDAAKKVPPDDPITGQSQQEISKGEETNQN